MPATAAWRRLRAIVPLTIAAFLATSVVASPRADAATVGFRINHAANVAIAQIGDPYRYGAAGPNAFDCSGLTMFSYGHAALSLPRTAAGQYAAVRHILKQNLMRGDLIFFHDSGGHVYHASIFLYWNDRHQAVIVHSPHTGSHVQRSPVWTSSWYAGTLRPMH